MSNEQNAREGRPASAANVTSTTAIDRWAATLSTAATQTDAAIRRFGPSALLWAVALLWVTNVSWKVPPNFGASADGGCRALCAYVKHGYEHPVLPGSGWVFEHVIEPNLSAFGWITLILEALIPALLLSRKAMRFASVAGLMASLGIFASVANADHEWYWSYLLMAAVHLAVLVILAIKPEAFGRPNASMGASVLIGYGALVALAHIGEGLTGTAYSFWSSTTDFPDDAWKNLVPGSLLLGLVLMALGAAALVVVKRIPSYVGVVGAAVAIVSAVLLLTYDGELIVGLGSRATTAVYLAVLGLSMMPALARATDTDD